MRLALVLFASLASGCIHFQETRELVAWDEPSPVLVVRDARVFPATLDASGNAIVLEHHDVIVRAGRIESIAPTGGALPAGARVLEGKGRTLLPGLVDAHAHTHVTGAPPWYVVLPAPENALAQSLYAGVTTIHDL